MFLGFVIRGVDDAALPFPGAQGLAQDATISGNRQIVGSELFRWQRSAGCSIRCAIPESPTPDAGELFACPDVGIFATGNRLAPAAGSAGMKDGHSRGTISTPPARRARGSSNCRTRAG